MRMPCSLYDRRDVEPSTPNSYFTSKNTDPRCVSDSKTPTVTTAAFSRVCYSATWGGKENAMNYDYNYDNEPRLWGVRGEVFVDSPAEMWSKHTAGPPPGYQCPTMSERFNTSPALLPVSNHGIDFFKCINKLNNDKKNI
uniref:Uncharacterized protein n=1 Tax=Anguilla anguilla TaxID=7936 RepID=A0A0E9X625_ANGAN